MRSLFVAVVLSSMSLACGGRLGAQDGIGPDAAPVDPVAAEAGVASPCAPRAGDGSCTLCDGKYYCPGWAPAPPCEPGIRWKGACTTTCVACPGDGVQEAEPSFASDAWFWNCTAGTYGHVFSQGFACPE